MMASTQLEMTDQDIVSASRLFGLLAEPNRLRILVLLCDGEMNVSALCAVLGLPQPTVSHHLGLMRRGNLLQARRSGKMIHYALDPRVTCVGEGELIIRAMGGIRLRLTKGRLRTEPEVDGGDEPAGDEPDGEGMTDAT